MLASCAAKVGEKQPQPPAVEEGQSPHPEGKHCKPQKVAVASEKPLAGLENQTTPGGSKIPSPKGDGGKRNTASAPVGEIPRRELVEIAKLAVAKGNPVVRKVENFLIEAIPKGEGENCRHVVVKVKADNGKGERDFSVKLCGERIEVNPL